MSKSHSIIELIGNRNFGNIFHHQNGPNQCQHRIIIKLVKSINPDPFKIPRTSSIPCRKQNCLGCGISNKVVRKLSMQNYGKLETCPFIGPFFIKRKSDIEHLLHNNNKNVSRPKEFNKNNDTSNTAPPQATISLH